MCFFLNIIKVWALRSLVKEKYILPRIEKVLYTLYVYTLLLQLWFDNKVLVAGFISTDSIRLDSSDTKVIFRLIVF